MLGEKLKGNANQATQIKQRKSSYLTRTSIKNLLGSRCDPYDPASHSRPSGTSRL
jgi:hypothetical protein